MKKKNSGRVQLFRKCVFHQRTRSREYNEGSLEMLPTVEKYGLGEKKFFNGDNIGFVDLIFGSVPSP